MQRADWQWQNGAVYRSNQLGPGTAHIDASNFVRCRVSCSRVRFRCLLRFQESALVERSCPVSISVCRSCRSPRCCFNGQTGAGMLLFQFRRRTTNVLRSAPTGERQQTALFELNSAAVSQRTTRTVARSLPFCRSSVCICARVACASSAGCD